MVLRLKMKVSYTIARDYNLLPYKLYEEQELSNIVDYSRPALNRNISTARSVNTIIK